MPRMKSLKSHEYAGQSLSQGEEFECEDRFVAILIGLGRAEFVAPQQYRTREMTAQRRRSKGA
jgi:hypothetical protein